MVGGDDAPLRPAARRRGGPPSDLRGGTEVDGDAVWNLLGMSSATAGHSTRPAGIAVPVRPVLFAALALFTAAWTVAMLRLDAVENVMYLPTAWAFIAAGIATMAVHPANRTGALLTSCGLLILPTLLQGLREPLPWTIGNVVDSTFVPVLFLAVFGFPDARLRGWVDRVLVAASAAIVVMFSLVIPLFVEPSALGCGDCPPGLNLLLVRNDPQLVSRLFTFVASYLIPVLSAAMIVRLVHRLWRATPTGRRLLAPLTVSTILWLILHSYIRVLSELLPDHWFRPFPLSVLNAVALASIPVGVFWALVRTRNRRSRIGQLVVELGGGRAPEQLRAAVARTLGDPSAEVGFWDRDAHRYVTAAGQPLVPPDGGSDRAVLHLEQDGEPLAVIIHDPAVAEDPTLVQGVAAAARFAVGNERLQAEVRAQLELVRASRARIVEAADAERRRVERNLHDGAQQGLLSLAVDLRLLADQATEEGLAASLDQAADRAAAAFDELRQLSRGLHPSVLSDRGLAPALEYLAESATLPVTVDVVRERFPAPVEATAYYVVAECLANATKHAQASSVHVAIRRSPDRLEVEVVDDGVGGADAGGSGLRGLGDRLATVDGELTVTSPPGEGTRVRAVLPCG